MEVVLYKKEDNSTFGKLKKLISEYSYSFAKKAYVKVTEEEFQDLCKESEILRQYPDDTASTEAILAYNNSRVQNIKPRLLQFKYGPFVWNIVCEDQHNIGSLEGDCV